MESNISAPQCHHPRKEPRPVWDKLVEGRNEDDLAWIDILDSYISKLEEPAESIAE